ncbi:hypothetical protein K1719_046363 [Acacia pycnantha]|nr:hypothetical protein K1719_046363 [Acacia pycnantha]
MSCLSRESEKISTPTTSLSRSTLKVAIRKYFWAYFCAKQHFPESLWQLYWKKINQDLTLFCICICVEGFPFAYSWQQNQVKDFANDSAFKHPFPIGFSGLLVMESVLTRSRVLFVIVISALSLQTVRSIDDDTQALLALKSSIDVHNTLPWSPGSKNLCDWEGVRDCFKGRVRKLVLENLNLTGNLDPKILNRLDQIRVLSFKSNSLSGPIPDLSALVNLKSIFLNDNSFSGIFPASISGLHRVKVIVFSGNRLSGNIPSSLLKLRYLYMLYLQDNSFTGTIPGLNQSSLRYLNVSNNQLSGEIPASSALIRFNESSFSGNPGLCGEQILKACEMPPSVSPGYPLVPRRTEPEPRSSSSNRKKVIKIVGGTIGGFAVLVICLVVICLMRRNHGEEKGSRSRKQGGEEGGGERGRSRNGRRQWQRSDGVRVYSDGEEVEGREAKEERLLVYDYFPNGSLFSLVHGSKTSGGGKPLHWTSCLKIAEDLATGLVYIHQNPGLTHGNLKSSNVLLGSDFESCLTDYGLQALLNPDSLEEPSATTLFYRAPECRSNRGPPTQQADVYSFGVGSVGAGRRDRVWVRDDPASGNDASEEKLQALLNIAMACVSLVPENRPTMRQVLKMIRDARAEAQLSSNSSDHSPGRWSDTVQSLPREEHSSI